MDMSTYEETRMPKDDDWAKYMKEGMEVRPRTLCTRSRQCIECCVCGHRSCP